VWKRALEKSKSAVSTIANPLCTISGAFISD
jgi:hypothetical protein